MSPESLTNDTVKPAAPAIERALKAARETRQLEIGSDLLRSVPKVFEKQFPARTAAIVADSTTFAVAGKAVNDAFHAGKYPLHDPLIINDPSLYAEHKFVEQVQGWLGSHDAIPIAVGSGTINDLTKLAAHRMKRPYMCVATAASMDGYTAFGASITYNGVKQTFECPAPAAVIADLEIIRKAPTFMNAAGYADLLAKITAGADWIVADALGIEPIDSTAWELVQVPLKEALSDPAGVRAGDLEATRKLTEGLMMGGFAMQWTKSSRPASGAEHQFSHLWDMQHHTYQGKVPSHGFKVAIGTIAVARLYEHILTLPLDQLDIDRACATWAAAAQIDSIIHDQLGAGELADRARIEMTAKHVDVSKLQTQLQRLREIWPELTRRLRDHLPSVKDLCWMLASAGAPTEPEQIGISRQRLQSSFQQAYLIRRRFTILDLAARAGILSSSCDYLFSSAGPWSITV